MNLADSIKPISYLKVHASEIIRDVSDAEEDLFDMRAIGVPCPMK